MEGFADKVPWESLGSLSLSLLYNFDAHSQA